MCVQYNWRLRWLNTWVYAAFGLGAGGLHKHSAAASSRRLAHRAQCRFQGGKCAEEGQQTTVHDWFHGDISACLTAVDDDLCVKSVAHVSRGPGVEGGAGAILVDNMTPADVAIAVSLVAGRCPVEVSGGVTLDTVAAYAAAGADLISVGAITHSAPVLDVGLDLRTNT